MAKSRSSEGAAAAAQQQQEEPKLNYFQKLWRYRKYMVIEPFFFFYFMASVFNSVAMANFPLAKACRVNLGYNQIVCDTMLDKSELGIDCDEMTFENTTTGASLDQANIMISSPGFNYTVCKAESEAQFLAADVSGKRAPIAAIFPLLVLLFAGGWADRYNKRKPCMIVPIVGEALGFLCQFISAIFFDSVPMEFGAYCEAIVPALFGGLTFCLMAIYSYITIATPEEDRIFRFGIFAMFVTGVPFLGQPISGQLFTYLGYPLSFASAFVFQIIAITYIIFYIHEIKPKTEAPALPTSQPPSQSQGADNMAYETTNVDDQVQQQGNKNVNFQLNAQMEAPKVEVTPPKRSFFAELFDLTLVMELIKFPWIKRPNKGRLLLILLIFAYFLTVGPASGENDYWYRFVLKKLNWNGDKFSIYLTLSSGSALVGTFIGTAILSKLLKFADSTIGLLSAIAIVCSRVLFAFSTDTASFYAGGVVEMFVSLRVIAIKTIGSSIVAGDELSKMYAIFGISEPIGQFIFPIFYSEIYKSTVDTFPGAFFLFSEIFYLPNVLVFITCYIVLRRIKSKETSLEMGQNGNSNGHTNPDNEITSL
ncbi:probable peptidoglycan muropeptide transporter SLC46 isoform X1 [Drosophila tropicalis]|uniref:probable peptidoglycan muropeptide transporter SLC46 isoform X1 n=1 Tax=Drosophila tropicalis TaxID=46794 RepID=UPI0035ABD07B